METRIVTALARGTAAEVAEQLSEKVTRELAGATPALAIVFASPKQPLAELLPALRGRLDARTLVGASSAGEFTEAGDANESASIFVVAGDFEAHASMATGLAADPEAAVTRAASGLPSEVPGYPHRTAVLLLDPLAGNGEEATLIAATILGDAVRLAGGAAADDLKMAATWVGTGDRAATDAIVLVSIFSKRPLGVGVCHGHRVLSAPMKITRATGNVVHEIEGRPAWDAWVDATRERAREHGEDPEKLQPDQVGAFLLKYEAGLSTGGEYKIRAPLSRQADGSLNFACGIPEGAVIRITESEPQGQVDSARKAARRAREQVGGEAAAGAVVFDCICRKLILGDRFADAVRGISEELGGAKLAGFETYGEIALDAGDLSGFHNTTTVVLSFPR